MYLKFTIELGCYTGDSELCYTAYYDSLTSMVYKNRTVVSSVTI